MSGTEVVSQIVSILVAGITQLGTGIGAGVSNFANALAFTTNGNTTEMSVYFIFVCAFGGIALAVGITQKIFAWLSNLGN